MSPVFLSCVCHSAALSARSLLSRNPFNYATRLPARRHVVIFPSRSWKWLSFATHTWTSWNLRASFLLSDFVTRRELKVLPRQRQTIFFARNQQALRINLTNLNQFNWKICLAVSVGEVLFAIQSFLILVTSSVILFEDEFHTKSQQLHAAEGSEGLCDLLGASTAKVEPPSFAVLLNHTLGVIWHIFNLNGAELSCMNKADFVWGPRLLEAIGTSTAGNTEDALVEHLRKNLIARCSREDEFEFLNSRQEVDQVKLYWAWSSKRQT